MNKTSIITFLLLFPLFAFSQIQIKIDSIEVKQPYEFPCFNYPNSIELNYLDFDSISFKGGVVTYFNLQREKMITESFRTNHININPSGKLSAHYASKKEPISITFKKATGYKNGEKRKIEIVFNKDLSSLDHSSG